MKKHDIVYQENFHKERQNMNKIEQAESILKKYNQNHIKIKTEEQAEQILEIDFAQLEELYQYAIK